MEIVLGDLIEEYKSGGKSRWWVARQLLSAYTPEMFEFRGDHHMLSSMGNDVRFAVRTLARNPGFAAVAIVTIALGVGINAGIFSLLNAAALRPLPVPGASNVLGVYQIFHGKHERSVHGEESLFSTTEYETYRDTNHVFSGTIAYAPLLEATLGGEVPKQIYGQFASCNYFDVLEEHIALGRGFMQTDCAGAGTGAVVVLSDDLWRNQFGRDAAIVGKTVILNRQIFTVAGVAPPGFRGTEAAFSSFWVPFTIQPTLEPASFKTYGNQNMSWLVMLGRTKSGVAISQVRADLAVIAARIDQLYPGRSTTLAIGTATFASMPEARSLVTGVGGVILAAVAMVLLIVCANLANLLLARAAGRQKEIAIRLSVGATRGMLIRQLMTESLLIAITGGIVGCAASFWLFGGLMRVIMAHLPSGVPEFALNLGPDIRVLAYSLAMTLLTGIAFGLAPALRATGSSSGLNPGGLASAKSGGMLRGALVGVQVAVCMVLLISAGLMLRALYAAQTLDPGFEMKNTVRASFNLKNQGFTDQQAIAFQREVVERVSALPGVEGVAQAAVVPLGDSHWGTDVTPSGQSKEMQIELNKISPEYFAVLGIPIVRGRTFTRGEMQAAIVTESTARRFWPGEDALGKTLTDDEKQVFQVVGVAKDVQVSHLGRSNETYVYFPAGPKDQVPLQLLVHARIGLIQSIRGVIRSVDPNLAADIAPLEDNLEWWRTPSRLVAILAGSLGGLALLLASLGIYGVTAFTVSRRVREIGIRMALGADAGAVKRLILRQSMRPVLIGAAVGIAGCAGVSQILSSMLFGVSAYDPIAFVGVPLVLIAIALFASHMPARRATKVDPMIALRYE